MDRSQLVNRFISFVFFVALVTESNACGEIEIGNVSLKMTRPFVTTQGMASAAFTISNGLHNAITHFEVGDDGFGYDVEKLQNGKWRGSGQSWCATGRKLKTLGSGETYEFDARCDPYKGHQRIVLEYWRGEPLVTPPQTVFSVPFVTMSVEQDETTPKTNEVESVVLLKSPVRIPPMRGDPMIVDALTALILTTGGGLDDWSLRRAGIHRFAKKLGPFEYMEVKEFEPKYRRSMFDRNILYGGQASHVISTAVVHSVSYTYAVLTVRRIGDRLKKELRALKFVEEMTQGSSFAIRSVEGRYGGWIITIRFTGSESDGWYFQLQMERTRENSPCRKEEISVDVDMDQDDT